MTVDKWADGVWADVRGPLNKMMDDAVLKNRTGELPAFAQFSTLGKFIFTFRSFVLGSHNKVLAGTMGRHGFAGLGLLMAYQFPLAMATTYAVGAARGKPESDMNKLAMRAIGQQSAMGLFTELFAVVSGDKQQFGASGLMAIDRLYKTTSQAAQGSSGTQPSRQRRPSRCWLSCRASRLWLNKQNKEDHYGFHSTQRAVSDGTLTYLDISIGYQSRNDIKVFMNDLPAPSGSWAWAGVSDKRINFTPAVPAGVEVMLQLYPA